MECPNCHHVYSQIPIKCTACGQVYSNSAIADLQNLEYLTAWLDEHQGELAASGYRGLRQSAGQQLAEARHKLVPPVVGPGPARSLAPGATAPAILPRQREAEPAAPAPAPVPARAAEDVVRELVLEMDISDELQSWVAAGAIGPATAESLRRYLAGRRQRLKAERAGRPAETPRTTQLELIEYAQRALTHWNQAGAVALGDRPRLQAYLKERREALLAPKAQTALAAPPAPKLEAQLNAAASPAAAVMPPRPPMRVAPPIVAAPRRPAPPPKPAQPPRPPINWSKVWERTWQLVVSGALLRGLLYLGALMIVASAVVLVVRFWNTFPGWLQIGFVAAVPASFYAGGFALRRLKIPVAGSVFTGIGALLVAVDLAAIYQLAGLARVIDVPIYWLGSAVFCAALYLFTLYRSRGEFFGYLALIGGGNVIVALAVALHLRPEWWVAAGALAGLGMVAVAGALKTRTGRWPDLAGPARYFSQLVLPAAAFLAVAVALFVNPHESWGPAVTLALVAASYASLAWRFGFGLAEYAAVASSVFAAGFAANALGLPIEWWGGAMAVLAAAYSGAGRRLDLRRRAQSPANRSGRWAWYGAAGLLAAIGLLSTLVTLKSNVWPAVGGLVLIVLLLTGWARLFGRPLFSFAAGGLFIVPFTAAVGQGLNALTLGPEAGWVAAAWTGLALGYLALGTVLRPAERHARWLYFWAHLVTGLACVMLASVSWLPATVVTNSPAAASSLAALAGLAGALAVYTASAAWHHGGRHPALSRWVTWLKPADEAAFLWPIGLLLAAWLAAAWWHWALPLGWSWFGTVLAGLGLVYVGLGQVLARRRPAYRLPWHVLAYALLVAGTWLALGQQLPLAVTLFLAVATLAALAWVHRRPLETFLAAALFVVPFQLTLNLTPLLSHAAALAYALLAALAYYPIGLRLRRAGGTFAWPVLGMGYVAAAVAVVVALLGTLGQMGSSVPWIGAAAPLVVLALLVASSYHLRRAPFAWAAAAVLPITYWEALNLIGVPAPWVASAWVGLAFAGLLLERQIAARAGAGHWLRAYIRPQQVMAVAAGAFGLGLTAKVTLLALTGFAGPSLFPAILAQALSVALASLAARLHHSRWPLYAAPVLSFFAVSLFFIAYSVPLFGQPLSAAQFGLVWMGLALVHLVAALLLDRTPERYAHGLYAGGYALALLAVGWTLLDAAVLLWTLGLGIAIAAASAGLVRSNRHYTWDEVMGAVFGKSTSATTSARQAVRGAFLWLAAWPFPIWCVLLLRKLNVSGGFEWLGLGAASLALLGLAVWLGRKQRTDAWPLHSAAQFYVALGLLLGIPVSFAVLSGSPAAGPISVMAAIVVQALAVVFYSTSARVFRQRGFAHLAAWLTFAPFTLGWIVYGRLSSAQLALPWMGLAVTLLALGLGLDRAKVRYAHGPFLAGYALALFAVGWTLSDAAMLIWTLGLGIAIAAASAGLVRSNRHRTWDDVMGALFGKNITTTRQAVRGAFLWLAAWPFPIWCVLVLQRFNIAVGFEWLGFELGALPLLGLAIWLGRAQRTDAWPLHSAAQFYVALGLLFSLPATFAMLSNAYGSAASTQQLPLPLVAIGCTLLQAVALVFYAASARVFRRRGFAHLAAWLTLVPYTLAWSICSRISPAGLDWLSYGRLTAVQLALPWLALAAALLAVGLALDRAKVRYAHGPYLAGYALALFAMLWSTPDRAIQIVALGAGVLIALASQTLVHLGRHLSFDEAIAWIWRRPGTPARRAAHIAFLFFAAYVFPFFLTQLLGYWAVPLTWRGLALALAAPLYIAVGLAARQWKAEYTWPLYSAGYLLTALGAMLAFENEALAIYVLALDLVVYAASAVIFRQAFWLYLSNLLLPIIALVALHYNHSLTAPWVAGLFMGLASAYVAGGRWLAARRKAPGIAPMALPFLAPAYLLSAVALAVASGERSLALAVFSAGVVFYGFSAWTFRETLLLYPAAWLAAVPYYLALTLAPVPAEWLGLAWLPFILSYVVLGRFVFRKTPLAPDGRRGLTGALTRASTPFYLLAYALSVSMVIVSQRAAWPLTLALTGAAALYFGSAALFRRATWLYPALAATHLALLAFLAVTPSNAPVYFLSVPFMGLTWVVALAGLLVSRWRPVTRPAAPTARGLQLGSRRLDWGSLPVVRHLSTPGWAQPFFLFAALDVVVWQGLALSGLQTGSWVAAGFMILLALFAVLWRDALLRLGALGLLLVAVGYRLAAAGVSLPEGLVWYGGVGFSLYWAALAGAAISERLEGITHVAAAVAAAIAEWVKPVTRLALGLVPLAALSSLAFVFSNTSSTAQNLGFAGAMYLAVAYRGRRYNLGYAAVATLEAAWALLLIAHDAREPQLYAIPSGLYFAGLAFFERRRGRRLFANTIDGLGLAVLLVTSFIQSLNGGAPGLPYFVLLIVEGLAAVWWGAARRIKIPFFAGLAAEVLNVIGQVVVAFGRGESPLRWMIIGGTGLAIVTAAVFVERQREQLIARAQVWREALATWS